MLLYSSQYLYHLKLVNTSYLYFDYQHTKNKIDLTHLNMTEYILSIFPDL